MAKKAWKKPEGRVQQLVWMDKELRAQMWQEIGKRQAILGRRVTICEFVCDAIGREMSRQK